VAGRYDKVAGDTAEQRMWLIDHHAAVQADLRRREHTVQATVVRDEADAEHYAIRPPRMSRLASFRLGGGELPEERVPYFAAGDSFPRRGPIGGESLHENRH
jgi:hypothetical protein